MLFPRHPAQYVYHSLPPSHKFLLTHDPALLYLHRGFFAQAIGESPDDPYKLHTQSVFTTLRVSFYICAAVRHLLDAVPLATRYSMFVTDTFSAMVILGTVVMKSPGTGLAPAAWAELEKIYHVLHRLQNSSRSVRRLYVRFIPPSNPTRC